MSAGLKIVFLTPGTGGWYCGACMRDNVLAKSLQAAGHEVSLVPMYLPLRLDEEVLEGSAGTPVFFGGINLYLQQKSTIFRHTPAWLDRLLDHPSLLRGVARRSHMTSSRDLGEMTLAMLRFDESTMAKEMDKLCKWLEHEEPDVICLSTALQAGMIGTLKRRTGAKIICCLQGEDSFLDGLQDPWRGECWRELALRVREADALVSPSVFYADLMRDRLGNPAITVIPNGIDVGSYTSLSAKGGPPLIGYLARMSREKGLEVMVDAFIHLRTVLGHSTARLHLAGAATAENDGLIGELKRKISSAGLADQVCWTPNISREEKIAMLGSLALFSVPALYPEAFGLYLIEAMASGVPVVQPELSSFPEIIGTSGGGVLVPVGGMDSSDGHRPPLQEGLARAWCDLLSRSDELHIMAERARRVAMERYDMTVMRDGFLALVHQVMATRI
ncbi:MAG: glycosyltransferase family 4 protein [Verrucomicrobiota bacterium]